MKVRAKINRALFQLTSNPQTSFWGTLALGLAVEFADTLPDGSANETMATNGRALYVNESFADSLSEAELAGVVAHETAHPALGHHVRRNGRDADRWNQAADYEANPILLAAGFTLPSGALVAARFAGMDAESIYAALEKESEQSQSGKPQPGNGQGAGAGQAGAPQPGQGNGAQLGAGAGQPGQGAGDPGGCGKVIDAAPSHDAGAMAEAATDFEDRVRQAIGVAKANNAGKLPGALESLARSINVPRLDPRELFRRFIDGVVSRDYSWTRPSRRFAGARFVMPGFVPDRPAHIVAMIDSSGSMDESAVAALTSEMQAALDEGAADRLTVAYADTAVSAHADYVPGDIITISEVARGGTAFRQPLEWIKENCPDASAILYLTDMDTTDWGEQPDCPLLWIVTGEPKGAQAYADRAPFGEPVIYGY